MHGGHGGRPGGGAPGGRRGGGGHPGPGGMRRGVPGPGGMGMGGRFFSGCLFSPLLTGLMSGGLGYLFGSTIANQQGQRTEQTSTANDFTTNMSDASLVQLQKLGELRDAGVLTDEEFTREKKRLLGH